MAWLCGVEVFGQVGPIHSHLASQGLLFKIIIIITIMIISYKKYFVLHILTSLTFTHVKIYFQQNKFIMNDIYIRFLAIAIIIKIIRFFYSSILFLNCQKFIISENLISKLKVSSPSYGEFFYCQSYFTQGSQNKYII